MIESTHSKELYIKVLEVLTSGSREDRGVFFDTASAYDKEQILCATVGNEIYNISSYDRHIARDLYTIGMQSDFEHMAWAIERVNAHGRFPKTLVDIGANIGGICIPAVARNLFNKAVVVEPHPFNCRLLRSNISLNGLHERIIVHEAAAGAQASSVELEQSQDNYGDHRVFTVDDPGLYNENGRTRLNVNMIKIDDLLNKEFPEDILIWIDVQGYEGNVLAGSMETLKSKPPIFMELWPYGLRRANTFELVKSCLRGYKGFYDRRAPEIFREIREIEDLYNITGFDGDFTDILVI